LRQSSIYHNYKDIKEEFKNILPEKKDAKKLIQPLLVESEQAELGDFPKNIEHVYWAYSNHETYELYEDSIDYCLFCKLTNGNYVYFEASGCGTCWYGMGANDKIYVSSNPENIFKYAMGKDIYEQYVNETE
jgi:hypothetical protein